MITPETTEVYVRVDLKTRQIMTISDQVLTSRDGRPVFKVAANSPRLEAYVIFNDPTTNVLGVRVATEEELVSIDADRDARAAEDMKQNMFNLAVGIKAKYDGVYIKRFLGREFFTTTEVEAAAVYGGEDERMLTVVKPLAIQITTAYNEWRHNECQSDIDKAMTGKPIMSDLEIQNMLDTFLTERGFDITIYHR